MTNQRKQLSDDEWLWEQEILCENFVDTSAGQPPPRRRDTVTLIVLVVSGAFVIFGGAVYSGWQLVELIRGLHL